MIDESEHSYNGLRFDQSNIYEIDKKREDKYAMSITISMVSRV